MSPPLPVFIRRKENTMKLPNIVTSLEEMKQENRDGVDLSPVVIVPYLIATGFLVAGVAAALYFNSSVVPYAVASLLIYVFGVIMNFVKLRIEHPEYWKPDEDDLYMEELYSEEKTEANKDDAHGIVIEEVIL